MVKKVRCAIIGCGRISVMHLASVRVLPQCELIACCDLDNAAAERVGREYAIPYYTDYREMLAKEQIEAVHICLPHDLHTSVAQYALRQGVNVLCEKPMAIRYEDAVQTVALAAERGLLYGIIFQCRYNNASQLVKNAVQSGRLGRILSVSSTLTWARPDDYYASSDWKGTWEREGGGVVIDQAIHSIDLVNWIVDDEIVDIRCAMFNRGHQDIEVEDTAEGLITYRGGVKYAFYCMNNFAVDEPIEIKVIGEKGRAVFNYDEAVIEYADGSREVVEKQACNPVCEGGKDYWGFQHVRQIEQFYRACLGQEALEISGACALKTQKVICDLYEIGKKYLKN